MTALRHHGSSKEGTAHPPIFGVQLDCNKWIAERRRQRERIAAISWWRRLLGHRANPFAKHQLFNAASTPPGSTACADEAGACGKDL